MASVRRKGNRADTVQSELDDLQRRYRLMEVNRKSMNEDSQNTIRMQRQQIDKLKKDNERLKEDLALETRQARNANNVNASAQLARLQDQGDAYARKIAAEKRKLDDLDRQIKKLQESILQQRKDMGGINASKESNQQVQKQIRILENRLDKALVKFNEALAHNKQLRETIDNLRRERVVFDGIYKKLERELHEKKNKMAEIIEISNSAYEARDAAQSEMAALKAQADREQKEFEEKWAQLGQMIEKDKKVKDFVKLKERSTSVVSPTAKALDPAQEEEAKLRKRVSKGAFGIAKDKASIQLSMEKVQSYEDAFAKIQAATGISDIDTLVQTFIQAEDSNFQLFNQLNNLTAEIEKLEENIEEIRSDLSKYQGQQQQGEKPASGSGSSDGQRKRLIDELEQQLARTEQKSSQYDDKYQQAQSTVNSLKKGIASIFSRIGYNNSFVQEMLGQAGVTESNMMQYLGLIEQRTNELLQLYAQQRAEEQSDGVVSQPATLNSPVGAVAAPVFPLPSSEETAHAPGDVSDDEEEQPISIEEMNRISRVNRSGSGTISSGSKHNSSSQLNQLATEEAPAPSEAAPIAEESA